MLPQDCQLPEDDVRAQELIFWLKRLSLEIPESTKPTIDFSPLTQLLRLQEGRLELLETQLHHVNSAMQSLNNKLDCQSAVMEEFRGHLVRIRGAEDARLFQTPSIDPSQTIADRQASLQDNCLSNAPTNDRSDTSRCRNSPVVISDPFHIPPGHSVKDMVHSLAHSDALGVNGRKRRLISVRAAGALNSTGISSMDGLENDTGVQDTRCAPGTMDYESSILENDANLLAAGAHSLDCQSSVENPIRFQELGSEFLAVMTQSKDATDSSGAMRRIRRRLIPDEEVVSDSATDCKPRESSVEL